MSPRAAALLEAFGFEDVWDYADGKMGWMSRGLPTEGEESDRMTVDILAMEPALLNLRMSTGDVVKLIDQFERTAGVVVNDEGVVLGTLTREAADKVSDGTIESVANFAPKTYRANGEPSEALDFMERYDEDHVVVSDPRGKLIGMLYRDVVEREARNEG